MLSCFIGKYNVWYFSVPVIVVFINIMNEHINIKGVIKYFCMSYCLCMECRCNIVCYSHFPVK